MRELRSGPRARGTNADSSRFAFGKSLGLLAGLLMVLGTGPTVNAQPAGMKVGEPFPLIRLPSLSDGRPMSIADFRGKKVVLHIWASW